MSNDGLNQLLATLVSFQAGEVLSHEKLNALVSILSENISHLSGAVGDIYDENFIEKHRSRWGHSFNSSDSAQGAASRRLDIANIGRLIGPASNLNPQSIGSRLISEEIPAGISEYQLKYPTAGVAIEGLEMRLAGFDNTSQYMLVDGRKVVFSSPLQENKEATYITSPSLYNGGPNYPDARFNVYPDPNQPEGLSVEYRLENSGNTPTYTIDIGSITSQQISLSSEEDVLLTNSDLNFGLAQKLPKWIDDLEDGSPIPKYALYLKNYTTNEAYTTATYTKVDSNTILMSDISIGNQACIDGFDLRLVTVGTDITTSIDDLRNKMFLHKHDGSFGEPLVEIQNLAGIYKTEAPSGVYGPSQDDEAWNVLPAYLHRDGWSTDFSEDVNGQNAMRGPLMMGSTSFDPLTNKTIVDGDTVSQPIYFADTGKYIFGNSSALNIISSKNILSFVNETNRTVATTISLDAQEIAVNVDSFIVEQKDLNNEIYVRDETTTTGVNFSTEPQSSVDHDLQTTNYVSKRKRSPKQTAAFQLYNPNPDTSITFSNDSVSTWGNYSYFNGFEPVQWWERDAPEDELLLDTATINGEEIYVKKDQPPAGASPYDFINLFWTRQATSLVIKNYHIEAGLFKLFVFSPEVTCNYYFKLWAKYGDSNDYRIHSPAYRITNSGRRYRPFELHIDRGNCLALNFNSFEADYIYEHSFTVDIDMLSLGDSGVNDTDWGSYNPYVVLNYNCSQDVSGNATVNAEELVFNDGYVSQENIFSSQIKKVFASGPSLDAVVHEGVLPGEEDFGVNLGDDFILVKNNDVHIRVGRNLVSSTGETVYGVLEFDKLFITERIEGGQIFVEVQGFRNTGATDASRFERWSRDTPEIPPED